MSKHTPGPWSLGKRGKTTQHIDGGHAVRNEGWWSLAKVYVVVDDEPSEAGEANARLIAAAPEMLASLVEVMDWLGRPNELTLSDEQVERIRAAIAKATGEGA